MTDVSVDDGKTRLATYLEELLSKFPSIKLTVAFLPNSGIEISNYTWADYGQCVKGVSALRLGAHVHVDEVEARLTLLEGGVDFDRNWTDYERGFGDLTHESWLGLDKIHRLTSSNNYILRVDLEDFDGSTAYAEYRDFRDSIDVADSNQNNQQFTTRDQDHDLHTGNCARDHYHGAWWYSYDCGYANLNGEYKADGGGTGIMWYNWKKHWRSYKHVEMKVKPWS
nr:hypothetical protein BaRGS_017380 [Batillaria attramentaria]